MKVRKLFVDDTSPRLSGTVNASLVGVDSLTVVVRWADETTTSKSASPTEASKGKWQAAEWNEGDIQVPGPAKAYLRVVFSNGKRQTFGPAAIMVEES